VRYFVSIDGVEQAVDLELLPDGRFRATADGAAATEVEVTRLQTSVLVRVGQHVHELVLDPGQGELFVYASGRRCTVAVQRVSAKAPGQGRAGPERAGGVVLSPMPGKVVQLLVKPGDAVVPSTPVVVVEAMKMENQLTAGVAGNVQEVLVQPGNNVERGTRLVVIA
jgi:biotin carboxyl carrier protein